MEVLCTVVAARGGGKGGGEGGHLLHLGEGELNTLFILNVDIMSYLEATAAGFKIVRARLANTLGSPSAEGTAYLMAAAAGGPGLTSGRGRLSKKKKKPA